VNLRKDHYRSFTRTLSTGLSLWKLGGARFLARVSSRLSHPASADSRLFVPGLSGAAASPPTGVRLRASVAPTSKYTTLVDGYLGMSNDEERSEMRYVVRIAEFSESSNL
jgi:hypothetical protein